LVVPVTHRPALDVERLERSTNRKSGGTSAHVMGAGLMTLAVGPARPMVAMTAVLVVQALPLSSAARRRAQP
jgi:hypothetical protein